MSAKWRLCRNVVLSWPIWQPHLANKEIPSSSLDFEKQTCSTWGACAHLNCVFWTMHQPCCSLKPLPCCFKCVVFSGSFQTNSTILILKGQSVSFSVQSVRAYASKSWFIYNNVQETGVRMHLTKTCVNCMHWEFQNVMLMQILYVNFKIQREQYKDFSQRLCGLANAFYCICLQPQCWSIYKYIRTTPRWENVQEKCLQVNQVWTY